MVILVILFNGMDVFLQDKWSTTNFVTSYISLVVYVALYLFWKVTKRCKFVTIPNIDLVTGTTQFDEMDAFYKENEEVPTTALKRFWRWLF